ncbi:MAG: 30S ribosomal protein S12 methylthiotransferase RimO [Ruminococcus sp.]|jgi:ribosomal protein S12 methylthiotransferase|nr:30S ribosomal protein S12 methylthiotransferase RimO [Ruminococcus sp.]
MLKVGIVSLGCSKNLVDSERILARLRGNYEVIADPALADVAIINTCGFIKSAKEEAIETILEFAKLKEEGRVKKLIITGCLAERYKEELEKEFPEADAVIGLGSQERISEIIYDTFHGAKGTFCGDVDKLPLTGERIIGTLPFMSYLKIAEGCDNRCTYCAIPSIRGRFRSVPEEELVKEAETLAERGVTELNIVAQDITRYGEDLYNERTLPRLLKKLCRIEKLKRIRLLYAYPDKITDELIDVIAAEPKIARYIDIPIQHCDSEILRRMNRPGDEASLIALIEKLREKIPGIVLRTTVIVGFPGETEEQFDNLCRFIKKMRFERLGCFPYSEEEGTPAADFPDQIPEEERARRADIVSELQSIIMAEQNEALVGQTLEVLVEGYDRYGEVFFGRSYMDATDIDGKIFIRKTDNNPKIGEYINVLIDDLIDIDLIGERV